METLTEHFMSRVDAFLDRTGMGPTTLGRQAVGDPNLVRQLRDGRSPTLAMVDQVMAFMEAYDQAPSGDRGSSRTGRLRDSASRARRQRPMTRAMDQGIAASRRWSFSRPRHPTTRASPPSRRQSPQPARRSNAGAVDSEDTETPWCSSLRTSRTSTRPARTRNVNVHGNRS